MVDIFRKLPRRRRLLLLTLACATIILMGSVVFVWIASTPDEVYLPGEKIEGLNADLLRSLPADYPRVEFVDAANEAGLSFTHFEGKRSSQLPEDMGSGAAWGDYNADGWLDLFIANMVGPLTLSAEEVTRSPAHCALYLNNKDGSFTEVSASAGVDYRGWAMAAAWGDYDNDSRPDLFVSTYGECLLYRNNGDGTFSDASGQSGLGGYEGFWAGASWADYDKDGFLDLYVCGYVKYTPNESGVTMQYSVEVPASINPSSFAPERNLLFRNRGDGTFEELARTAGVLGEMGRSLSAAWCDFDEDGWPDLYVANDVSDNALYINQGDGTFEEVSLNAWVADYRGAMGIAVGDWDGDLDLDMFVTHWIAQENALYNNLLTQFSEMDAASSTVRFMDEADRFGVGQIALDFIGWGTSFFDYDNDGRRDLFVANGSTIPLAENALLLQPMADQLFWNNAEEGFFDVSKVSGDIFSRKYVGRGAAFADYDNDGDVDILVINNGGPAMLLKNEGGNRNNWLNLELVGTQSNTSAIGATVRIVTAAGEQISRVGSQSSYCSQNSLRQHFGLGSATKVDLLEINWPSGVEQRQVDLPVNQFVRIIEETGQAK